MATLTIVMVLFFVMAMVAAYTNRNLIFEQRTSANSFRSAQALTVAEAGVDWALAMLNGGTIGEDCVGVAGGNTDFRSRYLNLGVDGAFTTSFWPSASGNVTPTPSCVMSETGWNCSCPNGPTVALPVSGAEAPVVFRITLERVPSTEAGVKAYPGVVPLTVRGCTAALKGQIDASNVNSDASCHRSDTNNLTEVDAQAGINVALGLVSALPVAPVAPLTVGGAITQAPASTLRASNPDPSTGVALHAGGDITDLTAIQTVGPAGSAADLLLRNDAEMNTMAASSDTFFQALFGMMPADYQEQPAAVKVACGGGCTSSTNLAPVLISNPTRVIWINGNLTFDVAATFGSANQPVMIVVTGNLTFSAPVTVYGAIYSGGNVIWTAGGGTVIGAVVAIGSYTGSGNATFAYDQGVVRRLRQSYGSFVRVPGSWRIQY